MVHSSFSLTDQVAVVTGADRKIGIGYATEELLCELGANVMLPKGDGVY